jgi:hypothetical protein
LFRANRQYRYGSRVVVKGKFTMVKNPRPRDIYNLVKNPRPRDMHPFYFYGIRVYVKMYML